MSWDKEQLDRLHGKIEKSAVFLSLFSEGYKEDPTALVQLVFAMMLDKPIYILAHENDKVPKAFLKACDGIAYYKNKEEIPEKVQKLIKEATLQ